MPMDPATAEKAFAAERDIAIVRVAVIGFNSLVYCFLMDRPGTIPWLAYAIIVVANPYGWYVYFFHPYRRWPIMLSSYFTWCMDGGLILLWIVATGSYASPFYVLWYASLTATAFRFTYKETQITAVIYSAAYLAMLAFRGELVGHGMELTVRVGYIFLVAGLGAPLARLAYEQTKAKLEVRKIAAELERSNTELEHFAYVASHDLQEPLRMVASYTRLLEQRYADTLDADGKEFIGFAADGAVRMQQLIRDLLEYSRVGTRGRPFAPTACEAALAQAQQNLQLAIADQGAEVTHDPLPVVMGDAGQLTQIFQNLLGNAMKFRGAATPKIHVGAVRLGEEWQMHVRDNGIGLDPQYADRIFVLFQRLHTRAEYPGTGIGLAVCKKIVERHGGRIWVESTPGKGTTFFFTLPITTG